MNLPGRMDTQGALVRDYGNYVARFDEIAAYLARWQPPSLMLWGRHDPFFDLAEILSWMRTLPRMEAHIFDAGHKRRTRPRPCRSCSSSSRAPNGEAKEENLKHENSSLSPKIVKRAIAMDLKPYDFGADKLKATNAPMFFIHGDADGVWSDISTQNA